MPEPTRKEREKAAYQLRQAERNARKITDYRALRRANALYKHARMVYETDRDVAGEFSDE